MHRGLVSANAKRNREMKDPFFRDGNGLKLSVENLDYVCCFAPHHRMIFARARLP
jgi:hypothetical protein